MLIKIFFLFFNFKKEMQKCTFNNFIDIFYIRSLKWGEGRETFSSFSGIIQLLCCTQKKSDGSLKRDSLLMFAIEWLCDIVWSVTGSDTKEPNSRGDKVTSDGVGRRSSTCRRWTGILRTSASFQEEEEEFCATAPAEAQAGSSSSLLSPKWASPAAEEL